MTCLLPFQCITPCNSQRLNKHLIPSQQNSFQSLSTEERERIQCDLNGTATPIEETPDFIRDKLKDLDRELDLLSEDSKRYYILAVKKEEEQGNEEYVRSQEFLVMFLRAERFNAKLTAMRLSLYFKEKKDLFGEEILARRVKQSDLNEEDTAALKAGVFYVTDATDHAGRLMILVDHQKVLTLHPLNIQRAAFYLMQIGIENNEITQRKGVVAIDYNITRKRRAISSTRNAGLKFTDYQSYLCLFSMMVHKLPFRTAVMHACYNDIMNHVFLNITTLIAPKEMRANFQCHHLRNHEECMIELMTYGIDPAVLPFSDNGDILLDNIVTYLDEKSELEDAETPTNLNEAPANPNQAPTDPTQEGSTSGEP